MTTPSTTPAGDAEDAHEAIDRLRHSWLWLWLQVEPGRATPVTRPATDASVEALVARGTSDRAYRHWNLRRGLGALPPSPATARVDVLDVQGAIHTLVLGATRRIAAALHSCYVGTVPDTTRAVLDALAWLAGANHLPGWWIVDTAGACRRAGALDQVRDRAVLDDTARALRRADQMARAAAGVVGEQVRPIPHRCPACRRRSLQLDHDAGDARAWVVRCVSRTCRCSGLGCGCLQRVRVPGRAHAWSRGEISGPYGLTTAVAVADRVAAYARTARPRAGAQGHGGWSTRHPA